MVGCVETGDFRSRRPDNDSGRFTVQITDVPLASLRQKARTGQTVQQGGHRKKGRLTPISETMEEMERENSLNSFSSLRCDQEMTPVSVEVLSTSNEYLDNETFHLNLNSMESSFERSDTPLSRKKSIKSSIDECDMFEDELENIPEESESQLRDPEIRNILATLPPRPKCSRKILPPSVTGPSVTKPKRKKLLKLRNTGEHNLNSLRYSPLKEIHPLSDRSDTVIRKIADLDASRPKSAESGVKVIKLSELNSINSTSVPDLPTILSKLSKEEPGTTSMNATPYDESGALSTPRREPEEPLGPVQWGKSCLKGSDMTSFYNMWERDSKKRPFGKKSKKSKEVSLYRSCMCSLKHKCTKKCEGHKRNILPPIQ